jgi:uncharacterized RDD family membrane protein YckC
MKEKRIYAFIIDVITSGILCSIASSLLFQKENSTILAIFTFNYWYFSYYFFSLLYFVLFDVIKNGITIGKSLLSIINVDNNDGNILSLKRRITRSLLKVISFVLLPLSFFMFIFNNEFTIQDYFVKSKTVNW